MGRTDSLLFYKKRRLRLHSRLLYVKNYQQTMISQVKKANTGGFVLNHKNFEPLIEDLFSKNFNEFKRVENIPTIKNPKYFMIEFDIDSGFYIFRKKKFNMGCRKAFKLMIDGRVFLNTYVYDDTPYTFNYHIDNLFYITYDVFIETTNTARP